MSDVYWSYSIVFLFSLVASLAVIGIHRILKSTSLAMMFIAIFTVTYFVRPISLHIWGFDNVFFATQLISLDEVLPQAQLSIVLSIPIFAIGYRISQGHTLAQEVIISDAKATSYPYSVIILCIILLIWGYITMITSSPVIGIRSADVEMTLTEAGSGYTNTTGYLTQGNLYIPVAALLLYAITGNVRLVLVVSIPWILNRLYIGWGRANLVVFLLSLYAATLNLRNFTNLRLSMAKLLFLAIVFVSGLTLTMVVVGSNRMYFRQQGFSIESIIETITDRGQSEDLAKSLNSIAGFETTLYLLDRVPKNFDFGYGGIYLYRYFLQPIPRILWKGKPYPFGFPGIGAIEYFGSAPGSIGEAYGAFGFPGIALFYFVFGVILRRMEDWFEKSAKTPATIALYSGCYAVLLSSGRDSILMMLPQFMLIWGGPLLFARYLEMRHKRALEKSIQMRRSVQRRYALSNPVQKIAQPLGK